MYYREPRTPTGDEAGLTEVATRIAALAVEHHAAKEILARTQAELAQATYAANKGKAVASVADDLNQRLQTIVQDATKCLELLEEDKPDIANFRAPLTSIANHGRQALDIIARVCSSQENRK
jgi:C4-dicarboxylate-specific signal transduction histidine kinase